MVVRQHKNSPSTAGYNRSTSNRLFGRTSKERCQGNEDRANAVGSWPLFFKNIQTNVAELIHVGVKAWRGELDGRCRERVVVVKFEVQLVRKAFVDGSGGSFDGADPFEQVVAFGKRRGVGNAFHHEFHQFALKSSSNAIHVWKDAVKQCQRGFISILQPSCGWVMVDDACPLTVLWLRWKLRRSLLFSGALKLVSYRI